jgi:hypothetical protein
MQQPNGTMKVYKGDLTDVEEQVQSLKARARKLEKETGKAYPVFRVGEEVELKGGKFKIVSITKKGLRLRAIPY